MTRRFAIILFLLAPVGCTSVPRLFTGEVYRVDTPWYDSRTDKLDDADASESLIDIATYCFREDDSTPSPSAARAGSDQRRASVCERRAYARAQESAIDRDRLQDLLMDASDRECDQHKASSVGTNTGFNLGLSMLTSLLSGAATGFSSTTTKTALSAGAAFFSSTRAQLNEQVYRQLFIGTVLTAIDDSRQAQALDIMARRRYPVPRDEWDSRDEGHPLESVAEQEAAAPEAEDEKGSPSAATEPTTKEDLADADEAEGETDVESEDAPETGVAAEMLVDSDSLRRSSLSAGDDARRFYGIDEAIRDAAVYHARCSFYNGLVTLSTKVEEFSPCRLIEERRERLLAEVSAMEASGVHRTSFAARHKAYSSEIEALNTKFAGCSGSGG